MNKNESNSLKDQADEQEKSVQNTTEIVPTDANTSTSNDFGDLPSDKELLDAQLVLVTGMQGSGKTTKAKKIKMWLEYNKKSVLVIPSLEFMAGGNYIDLYQPDDVKGEMRRPNVVEKLREAYDKIKKGQLNVIIIVYSLDTTGARGKLGYEIGNLGFSRKNIVEYYAGTDPYLAMVMGVSALPNKYTVSKHLTSMSKRNRCDPAIDTNISRIMVTAFAIDASDNDLTERLQKIYMEAPYEYQFLYNALKRQTSYAEKIKQLMDKEKELNNNINSMTDMFTNSSIESKTKRSSTTNKFNTASASKLSDLKADSDESDTE